jgi:hypothetical protein
VCGFLQNVFQFVPGKKRAKVIRLFIEVLRQLKVWMYLALCNPKAGMHGFSGKKLECEYYVLRLVARACIGAGIAYAFCSGIQGKQAHYMGKV